MLVSEAIERAHCVAGVITNSVLLYCVRRHTKLSLGAYKQLLTIFASFDLFLTTLHGFVDPRMLIINSTFGVISSSPFLPEERIVPSFYCSCFSVPFALMNIHFLYRYWTVSRPHLIRLFSSKVFICFLITATAGEFVVWILLCLHGLSGEVYNDALEVLRSEFEHRSGRNSTRGWIIMDWNDPAEYPCLFPTLVAFDVIMIIALLLALTLGMLTFNGIRRAWNVSRSKANLQLRLFIAVIAQTIVPFICVYVPYFCCLTFTPLRLPVSMMADLCFFLTSCFPAWDAVIIILLMTDYRHAVFNAVARLKPPTLTGISQMTTMAMTVVPRR